MVSCTDLFSKAKANVVGKAEGQQMTKSRRGFSGMSDEEIDQAFEEISRSGHRERPQEPGREKQSKNLNGGRKQPIGRETDNSLN